MQKNDGVKHNVLVGAERAVDVGDSMVTRLTGDDTLPESRDGFCEWVGNPRSQKGPARWREGRSDPNWKQTLRGFIRPVADGSE